MRLEFTPSLPFLRLRESGFLVHLPPGPAGREEWLFALGCHRARGSEREWDVPVCGVSPTPQPVSPE